MSVQHAFLPQQTSYEERGDDLYETPSCATEALLRAERLPALLWEPAAGYGAIVDVLRAHGHKVLASDIADYGIPTHFAGRDFLLESKAPASCEGIVTNPPFKLATEFARHAVKLVPYVALLLRIQFLESTKRTDVLEHSGLARVWVFRNRLPRMHRHNWDGPRSTQAQAFCWFVWERDHQGPATLHRLDA
jgi:hypothetical protein